MVNESYVHARRLLLFLLTPLALSVPRASAQPGGEICPRPQAGTAVSFLVISPFAKENYVDHRITDQSSILRFIEDNWDLGRLGGGSTDAKAGTLTGFFDFGEARRIRLLLDPQTGSVISTH